MLRDKDCTEVGGYKSPISITQLPLGNVVLTIIHYIDGVMTTVASQITNLTIVYSIVYSGTDQIKHQSSASLAFVRGIHRDLWIPRTKGQLRGKWFHLMTSSCSEYILEIEFMSTGNWPQVNVNIVSCNGLVQSGNKPLPWAWSVSAYGDIKPHWVCNSTNLIKPDNR